MKIGTVHSLQLVNGRIINITYPNDSSQPSRERVTTQTTPGIKGRYNLNTLKTYPLQIMIVKPIISENLIVRRKIKY